MSTIRSGLVVLNTHSLFKNVKGASERKVSSQCCRSCVLVTEPGPCLSATTLSTNPVWTRGYPNTECALSVGMTSGSPSHDDAAALLLVLLLSSAT
jgi:hypothetical protein